MNKLAYFSHPTYLQHDTGEGHPESFSRLSFLDAHIKACSDRKTDPLYQKLNWVRPECRPELYRWISAIHHEQHIAGLKAKLPDSGFSYLDADTVLSPQSLLAAELAVSAALSAVDQVMTKEVNRAFCAVRPPGHHAENNRAMGFCLFNQVAIAARYVQEVYSVEKVCIIDFDVHHGNGTQQAFYDDPSIFYFSTHQYPCYPGSGADSEKGRGKGRGTTLNRPLAAGSGDEAFVRAYEIDLVTALRSFRPDFILLSSGFDAHRDDPLADCYVTEEGFESITQIICYLSQEYCEGRIVSCLEGGYDLSALAHSVHRHLSILAAS